MNTTPNSIPDSLTDRTYVLTKWIIFWSLLTFVGTLLTVSYYVGRISSGQGFDMPNALNAQMLRFQIWAALSMITVAVDRKLRSKSQRWSFLFPTHLAASFVWSAIALGLFLPIYWGIDISLNGTTGDLSDTVRANWLLNFVMGIFCYKIILTTNYALDYYKKFHEEKRRSALLETQLAQAQLQALKMQLQPHFLFNTLNSISHLALEDSRKAVQMIARLGDFLRLTIENNGRQQVSLERELEFLRNYLEIEQIRFMDRMDVTFDIEPSVMLCEVPNLILQPFVENAIKHGISKSMAAGKIKITADRFAAHLRIRIFNDGELKATNGYATNSRGLGISNTRERLEKLYGDDFALRLDLNDTGGVTATIEIPFIEVADR